MAGDSPMGCYLPATKSRTPEQVRMSRLALRAINESWTIADMSREANVSHGCAAKFMAHFRERYIRLKDEVMADTKHELVKEAQAAQKAAMAHLSKLRELSKLALDHAMNAAPKDGTNGRPVSLDEFGQPIPFDPKEFATTVKTCVSATRDLKKFADEVTGVDVVKAITIKTQSDKDGKMVSWSGVDSLANAIEAEIIKDVEALPMLEASPAQTWEF